MTQDICYVRPHTGSCVLVKAPTDMWALSKEEYDEAIQRHHPGGGFSLFYVSDDANLCSLHHASDGVPTVMPAQNLHTMHELFYELMQKVERKTD